MLTTPGSQFRAALKAHQPLPIVGTINAYCAIMAEKTGIPAIYLSGAGVANASYGVPDLGITSLPDVLLDAKRITCASDLPLLVDVDTGWGTAFNIARTVKEMQQAGVAAIHIEDQVQAKRCGHRPGKALVESNEMVDRVKTCVDARTDDSFVIMARTDAYSVDGLASAIERANEYVAAGADMLFPESLTTLEEYREFCEAVDVPVLANITEFGKTPLFSQSELYGVGVSMVLYPLSAFRAMNAAALNVYQSILRDGTQESCVAQMQTRDELYKFLDYEKYEKQIDDLK